MVFQLCRELWGPRAAPPERGGPGWTGPPRDSSCPTRSSASPRLLRCAISPSLTEVQNQRHPLWQESLPSASRTEGSVKVLRFPPTQCSVYYRYKGKQTSKQTTPGVRRIARQTKKLPGLQSSRRQRPSRGQGGRARGQRWPLFSQATPTPRLHPALLLEVPSLSQHVRGQTL